MASDWYVLVRRERTASNARGQLYELLVTREDSCTSDWVCVGGVCWWDKLVTREDSCIELERLVDG